MENTLEAWPDELRTELTHRVGALVSVERRRGLSRNDIWLARFSSGTVIVKRTSHAGEAHFYLHVAPQFDPSAAVTPQLYSMETTQEGVWLVLEHIPHPLPRARWGADAAALAVLRHFHQATIEPVVAPSYVPVWSHAMTQRALSICGKIASSIRAPLARLEAASQPLFADACWISGDPNPTNWGLRDDGSVVLFDWERWGRGTPALDLGIMVPGLGDTQTYTAVAYHYLAGEPEGVVDERAVASLTQQIALAKVWSVVEFLAMVAEGRVGDTAGVARIVDALPTWLSSVEHALHETDTGGVR
jgi:hypothetical protein